MNPQRLNGNQIFHSWSLEMWKCLWYVWSLETTVCVHLKNVAGDLQGTSWSTLDCKAEGNPVSDERRDLTRPHSQGKGRFSGLWKIEESN